MGTGYGSMELEPSVASRITQLTTVSSHREEGDSCDRRKVMMRENNCQLKTYKYIQKLQIGESGHYKSIISTSIIMEYMCPGT